MNRLVLLLFLVCGITSMLSAQRQPYLLLQGPSVKKTYGFVIGQTLLFRLQGEDEFFEARIKALYPESQTIRIDDMILSMEKIAAIHHQKRNAGLRNYLQGQGLVNLVIVGGFTAFSERVRTKQKDFLLGAAVVSSAMVVVGSFKKIAKREFGEKSRYVLSVSGGDIRKGDDGEQR